MTLSFDADTHTYTAGGVPLVSVTTAIKSAGLMGDTSFYTEESRDRGTAVHWVTERFDLGTLDCELIDEALAPYLAAYERFRQEHGPVWSHVETKTADLALHYAGTVDRAGRLTTCPHPVVLDIKSGGPAAWHRVQLSAYKRLLAAELPALITRYALYLSSEGTYRLEAFPLDDREDWQTFQAALAVAQWKRRYLK